ncbi:iron-sulfur cluster assembly accessory protein [Streptomyces blastmyceticus]|uniref:Iron-sulfur cluster assembly accessory protein n=1 Tax=Streptomyces blastmyceticus TaxID=68180 RepID=A0ABN0XBK3_9ACTN
MTETVSRVPVRIPSRTGEDGLRVTDAALRKIAQFLVPEGQDKVLRIGVKPGGCSGLSYAMYIDDEVTKTDTTIERDGIRIAVDQHSLPYLKGTTLDYQDGLMESGFTFDNPNASSSCGCGNSFN